MRWLIAEHFAEHLQRLQSARKPATAQISAACDYGAITRYLIHSPQKPRPRWEQRRPRSGPGRSS